MHVHERIAGGRQEEWIVRAGDAVADRRTVETIMEKGMGTRAAAKNTVGSRFVVVEGRSHQILV